MPKSRDEKRMELVEHLAELRSRIMRSVMYVLAGAIVAFIIFPQIFDFLYKPLESELNRLKKVKIERELKNQPSNDTFQMPTELNPEEELTINKYNELVRAIKWIRENPVDGAKSGIVFPSVTDAFTLRIQLSLMFGFILVIPFIVWEIALFVTPALTDTERKPLKILIPVSIVLLLAGLTLGYFTMYYAMAWFLGFMADYPGDPALMQNPTNYVMFLVKIMAAFGIAFQLPVVLMGMGFLGMISAKTLARQWRWGILIGALGALFAPSNDTISMAMLAVPLMILYYLSIGLVAWVQWYKKRTNPTA